MSKWMDWIANWDSDVIQGQAYQVARECFANGYARWPENETNDSCWEWPLSCILQAKNKQQYNQGNWKSNHEIKT